MEPKCSSPHSQQPWPVPILRRSIQSMNPSYFFKIHFNFILPPMPRSFKQFLSGRFPHQKLLIYLYFSNRPHSQWRVIFWQKILLAVLSHCSPQINLLHIHLIYTFLALLGNTKRFYYVKLHNDYELGSLGKPIIISYFNEPSQHLFQRDWENLSHSNTIPSSLIWDFFNVVQK